ncbi:MAG TPA: multicopper oxidase domain-containing protein [Acidimicrobiales bacterium]|nr:multicopper oxidase domain-containing protein [Acidimicrobiales bacterium]
MVVDQAVPERSGQGTVSRRAVLGATVGGIGAATLAGVTVAASWPDSDTRTATGGSGATPEAEGAGGAEIDFTAAPADDWTARDPVLPPAPAGGEHTIAIAAREGVAEVAPGTTQQLWSFDDLVPGPVYRGRLGDRFAFRLTNEGTLGHSVDFHASKVAWNDKMRTIQPGESLDYPFVAKHAGIFMYHCGTPPVLHHIGNGMYGAIVIDPPDLAPVDHELIFVQSEFYLGPEGGIGDLAKMQREAWDAVVFNGYVNQYQHRPIRVEPGQRIRAWVLDAGPSENCSFHVIGTIFDTVYKEGAYRLRPDGGSGGCQALDLQPAQGGFVEFSFDEAGLYPFVTHKFANPGKGALGVFQAGDVEPSAAAAGH